MFVGVDGCKGGWFAVALSALGEPAFGVFADIEKLWDEYREADVILIDIPIGLKDEGPEERACDTEARRLLAPERASSVFPTPCREALSATTYKAACDINERLTGKRLSKQTWAIVPKMREVDELLVRDAKARERIKEVHPEICFWALAAGRPMHYPKRSEQGYLERAHILQQAEPRAYDIIAQALAKRPKNTVARDDILDALSAAITASTGPDALATLPQNPETDAKGLPMQMVYSPQFLEYEWT